MSSPESLRAPHAFAPPPPDAVGAPASSSGHTSSVKRRPRGAANARPVAGPAALAALVSLAALAPGLAFAADPDEAAPGPAPAEAPRASKRPKAAPAKSSPPADAAQRADKELGPEERAARGVVAIERGGQTLALGSVLAGDGRILTALSPLGHGNDLEARYADGTTVRVKLGHHDRTWDLALLVPQTGRWPEGLTASSRDPLRHDATIRAFSLTRGKAAAVPLTLRSHRSLLGGDDRLLEKVLEIGSRVSPTDLGSPIIDEDGRVVAILARGCAPNENAPCTPVAFGIPVAAIRAFLRTIPPDAVQPAAWLGIQGVAESAGNVKGVRVLVVHPESPAEEANLRDGDRSVSDLIVAVDGVPVTSPEALAEAVRAHAVGEKVPLLVFGKNRFRQVTVTLRPAPDTRAQAGSGAAHPAELPPLGEAPTRRPAKRSRAR